MSIFIAIFVFYLQNLLIKSAGEGYILRFVARNTLKVSVAAVTSNPFDVLVGDKFQLALVTPVGTATGGKAFSPNPILAVTDRGLNVINNVQSNTVIATMNPNAQGALLLPAKSTKVPIVNGYATFQNLYINPAGKYFLTFTTDLVKTEISTLQVV